MDDGDSINSGGGEFVPPIWANYATLFERDHDTWLKLREQNRPREIAEARARWDALGFRGRLRVRIQRRLLWPIASKRRALGMWVGGIDEDELGGW